MDNHENYDDEVAEILESQRQHITLYWVVSADDKTKVEHGPYKKLFEAQRQAYSVDNLIIVETRHHIFNTWE